MKFRFKLEQQPPSRYTSIYRITPRFLSKILSLSLSLSELVAQVIFRPSQFPLDSNAHSSRQRAQRDTILHRRAREGGKSIIGRIPTVDN